MFSVVSEIHCEWFMREGRIERRLAGLSYLTLNGDEVDWESAEETYLMLFEPGPGA